MANPRGQSPLRYPGGKACLTDFITDLAQQNELVGGSYMELYAGGAGAALNLLYDGVFNEIYINDYDYNIYSFWNSVLNRTEDFIRLIEATPVTIEEWENQRTLFNQGRNVDQLTLGFATFFLNRTNRSGIIFKAGPIGGMNQAGNYLIDVRFNKTSLIKRIEKIGNNAGRIHLSNLDAGELIRNINQYLPDINHSLLYLDPPYYNKGKQLYLNNYNHAGHHSLSEEVNCLHENIKWLISYDNVIQIKSLYQNFRMATFDLNYTLQSKKFGSELLIFSENLALSNHIIVNGRTNLLETFRYQENEQANRIYSTG